MNEKGNNKQVSKPRTSRFAIASLLIPLFVFCTVFVVASLDILFEGFPTEWLALFFYIWPLGPIFGVCALVQIKKAKGSIRGMPEAIGGIIVGAGFVYTTIVAYFRAR